MTKTKVRTVEDALTKFTLIAGVGDGEKTACAMSMLAWIDGCGKWTDSPECAHPLVHDQVIRANDDEGTTPEMRAELVKAGHTGILDTWWIPMEVIVAALSTERDAEPPSQYERTLTMVNRLSVWKLNKTRANLAGANLTGANLAGANLTGANLTRAYLAGANLAGAYLAGAYLAGANLARANLAGAYLAGAYLAGANLTGANLAGAYLAGAYLAGANLAGANLARANLAGANLTRANLAGANLTRANGTPYGGMPTGWELTSAGLFVKDA